MYIHVTVITGARSESIVETKPLYFSVSVKEKAERNQANKKVIELMQRYFNNPPGGVRIVNGHQSPKKLIEIGEK